MPENMTFGARYYTPMERDYYVGPSGFSEYIQKPLAKPMFSTADIGTTIGGPNPFRGVLQAAIRMGVSKIELSASASHQPGVGMDAMGPKARQELRELADAAKVELISVHTPVEIVGNVSGLGERGFSEQTREMQLNEIKKAIDFAADTTKGGAVVVHTGEFPRSLFDKVYKGEKKEMFEMYPREKEEAIFYVVDKRTGQIVKGVRGDEKLFLPEYERDKNGNIVYVQTIDKDGKVIDLKHPVTGERIPKVKISGPDETMSFTKAITFNEFFEKGDPLTGKKFKSREEAAVEFFRYEQEMAINQNLGQAAQYELSYKNALEERQKLLSALRYWQEYEKDKTEEELLPYMQQVSALSRTPFIPGEYKKPSEYLRRLLIENEKNMQYGQNIAVAARAQAEEALKKLREDIVSIGEYALDKSTDSLAELGLYAVEKTRKLRKEFEKEGRTEKIKPIFIAPENIFPEMGFGSHPQELKEIVLKAREKFVKLLMERNVTANENEAKKLAEDHIKATLDTEHLGMWKRRFKLNPGETMEEGEKRFNKWYIEQVKDLIDSGVVGHVHIADGFGRGHANLPAGQGNFPLKEAIEYLKEKGYAGTLVSEGYGDPEHQITDAWSYFGSPIYAAQRLSPQFNTVMGGYFGRGYSPYLAIHSYIPIEQKKPWIENLPV